MNGVKFVVKIIPFDGVVIGVGRQLLKMFTQTRESNTKCREMSVLILLILNGNGLSVMSS
jgi:hypothetical protein